MKEDEFAPETMPELVAAWVIVQKELRAYRRFLRV